jgi:hypothetical protein
MEKEQTSSDAPPQVNPDPFYLLDPRDPAPGVLAVLARQSRLDEIRNHELSKTTRVWKVRGVVSDSVPLCGDPTEAFQREPRNMVILNEDPLSIYLHSGGHRAVYYDLVGDSNHKLSFIEVLVETRLPSNAITLARRPLNALLDVLTRDSHMPLTLQRVDLISPVDGEPLLHQMLLPSKNGVLLGPLGGIQQAVPFAPYDAIYREALTSSSPFYRLLCAARIFEGTGTIRKWLRAQTEARGKTAKLPPEVKVSEEQLVRYGLATEFVKGITTAQDLYHRLKDMRDAIAHFLIERDGADVHVYLAEGAQYHMYSIASAALLHYAHLSLEELRMFYVDNAGPMGSQILPMLQYREKFIVRASDYGVE